MLRARWETAVGLDVTPVLETLQVPTLVLHRADERAVPAILAREMADAIPGAHYVEVPGIDRLPWVADAEQILDEVEEFLTGARHATEADRVLATVMFTDIVDSTRRAAELGDRPLAGALVESPQCKLVRERVGTATGAGKSRRWATASSSLSTVRRGGIRCGSRDSRRQDCRRLGDRRPGRPAHR